MCEDQHMTTTFTPPSNRLRVLRAERGLSQAELASLAGVNRSALCRWEAGETEPRVGLALRLAAALRVSVEDLGFSRPDSLPVTT
jgi:putative transcriptional regulator